MGVWVNCVIRDEKLGSYTVLCRVTTMFAPSHLRTLRRDR